MFFLIAVFFFWLQNEFFGWNGFPQTPEELICDGVTILLFVIALK